MVVFAPAAARVSSQPSSLPLFVWVPYLCICHFYIQWNIFFRRVRKLVHYEKLWHWVVSSQRQQLGESVVANTCNLVEVDTLYSSSWMSAVFYYVRHLPPDCILNVHVNLQALFPWRRTLAIYYLVPLKWLPWWWLMFTSIEPMFMVIKQTCCYDLLYLYYLFIWNLWNSGQSHVHVSICWVYLSIECNLVSRWGRRNTPSKWPHRAGSRDALWSHTCTIYPHQSRYCTDDWEISSGGFWSLSQSLLWKSGEYIA